MGVLQTVSRLVEILEEIAEAKGVGVVQGTVLAQKALLA